MVPAAGNMSDFSQVDHRRFSHLAYPTSRILEITFDLLFIVKIIIYLAVIITDTQEKKVTWSVFERVVSKLCFFLTSEERCESTLSSS